MRPHQVWRHEMGTSADDDVLVYEEDDERFFVSVGLSLTEEWIKIGLGSKFTTEEWLIPDGAPTAARRVVPPRVQGVHYEVTHTPSPTDGDRFLIPTNAHGAVPFQLMTAL